MLKTKPEPTLDPIVLPTTGPVAYETPVVITTELWGPPGPVLGKTNLRAEYSSDSGATWHDAGPATWNNFEGKYQATVLPRQNAKYRFAFPGDPDLAPAESSASGVIQAKAYLGKPAAPTYVYRNKYFTLYGSVKPKHTGKASMYMYRYYSSKWHYYKGFTAPYVPYTSTTTSKYSIKYRVPYRGRYKVRVDHKDASHAANSSVYEYFTCK